MSSVQACVERLGSKWGLSIADTARAKEIIVAHSKSRGGDEVLAKALSLSAKSAPKNPIAYLRKSLHSIEPLPTVGAPRIQSPEEPEEKEPAAILELERTIAMVEKTQRNNDPSISALLAQMYDELDKLKEAEDRGEDVEALAASLWDVEEPEDDKPDWMTCPHSTEW